MGLTPNLQRIALNHCRQRDSYTQSYWPLFWCYRVYMKKTTIKSYIQKFLLIQCDTNNKQTCLQFNTYCDENHQIAMHSLHMVECDASNQQFIFVWWSLFFALVLLYLFLSPSFLFAMYLQFTYNHHHHHRHHPHHHLHHQTHHNFAQTMQTLFSKQPKSERITRQNTM